MDDRYYMKMALALAAKGMGYTSPNPMVGAVVVKEGRVVGKGWHQAVGGPHAEVHAIDDAGEEARGATLYVTLEPCNHTGKTPPCTEKILKAGIKRVVMAMDDPNPDVRGGGKGYLHSQGVQVDSGVCETEARKLNECFVKFVTTKRPFVTLKCASTLDGRIATRTGDSKWISGPSSRRFVHELRHASDAILVGINTVKTDDPSLTTRLEEMRGHDPMRVILDTRLSINKDAKVLRLESCSDTLIVCGKSATQSKKKELEGQGIKIVEMAEKNGWIDLDALMDSLGKMSVVSLLIEGGSRVIASALAAGIVDKVLFFYGPKILGGDDGIPICKGDGPDKMENCLQVKTMKVRRFDADVMIEGYLA